MPISPQPSRQKIIIDTDFRLTFGFTNRPRTVEVTGDMEYFEYDWQLAQNRVIITGNPQEELSDLIWLVKTNLEPIAGEITYDVVKPAPIFLEKPLIHLYRDVPINIHVPIVNPGDIKGNTLLLGLGLTPTEEGADIDGMVSRDANFSVPGGNFELTAPHSGGDVMRSYPYNIEAGAPDSIGAIQATPKGNYSEIQFTDVRHAIDYEYTLEAGDEATWHRFSDRLPIIHPSTVEVTPGNLNATITFPVVPGANSYEYQLVTEVGEGSWVEFVGTMAMGMITTIIPGLEDGVEYILRLRVASPWIGVPVPVTVVGGRTCYTLHIDRSANAEHYLYIFHTGHPNATQASRIKRLRLPSSLSEPDAGGLAVNSDSDVFILNMHDGVGNEKALYTFLADTIANAADGSQLIQDRKNPFPADAIQSPTTTSRLGSVGMAEYNNELYIYFRTANHSPDWRYLNVIPVPTMDGAELTQSRKSPGPFNKAIPYGLSVDAERIWYRVNQSGGRLGSYDRELFSLNPILNVYLSATGGAYQFENSFKILDNKIYNLDDGVTDRIDVFSINPEIHETRYIRNFYLILPTGLTNPRFLDILT